MDALTAEEASQLGKKLKAVRRRSENKNSIARTAPRRATAPAAAPRRTPRAPYVKRWQAGAAEATDAEKLREIERHIEGAEALPRSSRYAQHRLKVLSKAKQLLEQGPARTQEAQDELDRLLSVLSL
jgi:hypothetical protein